MKTHIAFAFLIKCFSKSLLIRTLKRDNQLHLFRDLEKCSTRLVKCEGAIEFLKLCQNFDVTPTFAQVDATKSSKWTKSCLNFQRDIVQEELKSKRSELKQLKEQYTESVRNLRQVCSTFRFATIIRTLRLLQRKQAQEMVKSHTKKLSHLINKSVDIDEHINNISSYHLSFFEKLILCRGLKFSLPQRIPKREIQASFEKAYWRIEPLIKDDDKKELACATLRSIALNYIEKKGPAPPKTLLRALSNLRKRDDIVISKPDKGSGVVVMDKEEYIRLLGEASINDATKFTHVDKHRPKTRGRPPKHYHPLLEREKQLKGKLHKTLPKETADLLCPKGSRLAHLYGLPKTHKQQLSMRPILSASGTYNYPLAKWLEQKLKPLSTNEYCISDIFAFTEELSNMCIEPDHILVSYDVASLFTNVPLKETINILVDKAFEGDWFNRTHGLKLSKGQLTELLELATSNQLFQFNGELYQQTDGVAMGSPLGPLLANVFMCHIEDELEQKNMLPSLYRRYVDDTLAKMPDEETAAQFLSALNQVHPNLSFTMELERNGSIPFLGTVIKRSNNRLTTEVYRKPTDSGLLLHHQSHVDNRYKRGLVNTMVDRAVRLSSTQAAFSAECDKLRDTFSKLCYPKEMVESTIQRVIEGKQPEHHPQQQEPVVYIKLPFKDQRSADKVRKDMHCLSNKIAVKMQPVFVSKKLSESLSTKERKPSIVNKQCVVYLFQCDSCDANYVGYTARHLHQRINEHWHSAIGKHLCTHHGANKNQSIDHLFKVLKKCSSKFDCLVNEMLFIRDINPTLNTQSDSIRAKLFT